MVLGRTGLEAFRLGFGGIPIQRVSEPQAVQTVVHALETGMDFLDSSRAYTTSERRIGLALKQIKKKPILASKSLAKTGETVRADLELSLQNLQTDYIDLYQCHFVRDDEDYQRVISRGGPLDALRQARAEGMIGHIGLTSHSLDVLDRCVNDRLFDTIMVCFSFLEPLAGEILIPKAIEKDIGVIAMKPFSGGVIEDGRLALKYALSQPGVLVLAGVESTDLIDQNWSVFEDGGPLTPSEHAEIADLQRRYDKAFCRRCDYCLPCSEDIPIQIVLGIRSLIKRAGVEALRGGIHWAALEKARDCTDCGLCETRCPYGLPIRELIRENLRWIDEELS